MSRKQPDKKNQKDTGIPSIFNSLNDSIFVAEYVSEFISVIRPDGTYLYANQAHRRLGYEPSELVGRPGFDLVHPEDLAIHIPLIQEAIEEGAEFQRSYENRRFRVRDKQDQWHEMNGTATLIEDGEGDYNILLVSRDVTERKRLEDEIQSSHEKTQALLNACTDNAFLIDIEGTILAMNDAVAKALVATKEELIGKNVYELIPSGLAEERRKKAEQVIKTGRPVLWTDVRDNRWLDQSMHPVFNQQGQVESLAIYARDITEEVEAKEALKKSEEQYRTLIENQGEGIGIVDSKEYFTFNNPAAERIFGVEKGGLIGRTMFDFVGEEGKKIIQEQTDARQENQISTYELEITRPDGELRQIIITATPRFDDAKNYIGAFGIFRDITERVRVEKALRESEERYRQIVESSQDIIYRTDANGRFSYVNPVAERLLGYPKDEVIGKSYLSLILREDRSEAAEFYQRQFSEKIESTYYEFPALRKNGKEIWLGQNVQLVLEDGEVKGFQSVARDITERRLTEIALRESEEKFRSISASAHDAIVFIDDRGIISFWNEAAEKIFGYTADEAIGKEVHMLLAPPDYHSDYQKGFGHFSATGQGPVVGKTLELMGVRKTGEQIPVELSVSVVKIEDAWNAIGIVRDISERKEVEEALRVSEEKYRTLVETASDCICIVQDERLKYANPKLVQLLGYIYNDIKELPFPQFIHPDEMARVTDFYYRHLNGERDLGIFETIALRKGGAPIDVEINASVIPYEGKPASLVVLRDITERKVAEQALRTSEERYRLVTEGSKDIIWTYDLENAQFTFMSSAGETILGYSAEEAVGMRMSDVLTGVSVKLVDETFGKMVRVWPEKRGVVIEAEHIAKDGRRIWMEVHGSLLQEDSNHPRTVVGVSRDITERKRAEKELQYRQDLLRMVTAVSTNFINLEPQEIDDGIYHSIRAIGSLAGVDSGYVFLFDEGQKRFSNTHEWTAEGIPRQTESLQNLKTSDFPQLIGGLRKLEPVYVEDVEQLPDEYIKEKNFIKKHGLKSVVVLPMVYSGLLTGFICFVSTSKKKLWNEQDVGVLKTVANIFANVFEHKWMNEAFRASEETGRALLNATADMVLLLDANGNIHALNESAVSVMNKDREELIGKNFLEIFGHDDDHVMRKRINEVFFSGQPTQYVEDSIPDMWLDVRIYPIRDLSSKVTRVAFYAHDITELKNTEAKLREALKRAKEAELLKSRFLANMSHEIRTPLNHIIGLSSLSIIQPETPEEERQKYLKIIKQSGESLLTMINTVLDLSRIEAGKMDMAKTVFEFPDFIDSIYQGFKTQAEGKGLRFDYYASDQIPPSMVGDPVVLEQVLNNLLGNVVKFTNEGKVGLHIDVDQVIGEDVTLHIQVSDTGIGIPSDQVDKVWQSFYQVDGSSTRQYPGSGLGLAITRQLVQQLGGKIWFESALDEGSVFHFTCNIRVAL